MLNAGLSLEQALITMTNADKRTSPVVVQVAKRMLPMVRSGQSLKALAADAANCLTDLTAN